METAKALGGVAKELQFPIECEGEIGYLVAGAACRPRMESEGMSVTDDDDRHLAWSNREYRTPLVLDAIVKTDSTSIRMKYGPNGNLILNWEVQQDTLVAANPVNGREVRARQVGTVPIDQWVRVKMAIDEGRMTVSVDDEERFTMKGNFVGLSEKLAICGAWGSRVTIKSVRVTERPSAQPATESQRRLHGLQPDELAPGLLGCLRGVLHYWNRPIPDHRFYALAGGAGPAAVDRSRSRNGVRIWGEQLLAQNASSLGIMPQRLSGDLTAEIRQTIEEGEPCLIFDEPSAEFALVAGCSESGCIVRTSDSEAVRPWDSLAGYQQSVYRLTQGSEPDAFRALVDLMVRTSDEAKQPLQSDSDVQWGTAALDVWLRHVEAGDYDPKLLMDFAAFWSKCRAHAAEFLYEMSALAGSGAPFLSDAGWCMEEAARTLEELYRLLAQGAGVVQAAAALLKQARAGEERTAELISQVVNTLKLRKEIPAHQFLGYHMSHVGAMQSCMDVLRVEPVSQAWLYGATGYAFVMAADEHITNRGPTFGLSREHLHRLAANIGLRIDGVRVATDKNNHAAWRSKAVEAIRRAIDAGLPCFGQGLAEQSETEVLYGYEPKGFLTAGWHQRGLTIPWEALGTAHCPCVPCSERRKEQSADAIEVQSGCIDVHWAEGVPAADAHTTVKEAFAYIVAQNAGSPQTSLPGYRYGSAAYEHWIRVVKESNAIGFHVGYLCDTWRECRSYAAPFLREAALQLEPRWAEALEEAARHYDAASEKWKHLNDLYPWMQPRTKVVDGEKRTHTARLLEGIAASEEAGLRIIGEIYGEM